MITPTLGASVLSLPEVPSRRTIVSRTVVAGASQAIGSLVLVPSVSRKLPPVALRRLMSCFSFCAGAGDWAGFPAWTSVMSTWATTSLGLNAASVIAFRLRSALSLSAIVSRAEPPRKVMPAATKALRSAAGRVRSTPITSPVDFISGPR